MSLLRNLGMKISAAQREFYRYIGVSADVESKGRGKNLHDLSHLSDGDEAKELETKLNSKLPERND